MTFVKRAVKPVPAPVVVKSKYASKRPYNTKHMIKSRSKVINALHDQGVTQAELARRYKLSRTRIAQILGKNSGRKTPLSDRTDFTGVHLSPAVKSALKETAKKEGKSVSAYLADLVKEDLKRQGVEIHETPPYTGERLPLEAE